MDAIFRPFQQHLGHIRTMGGIMIGHMQLNTAKVLVRSTLWYHENREKKSCLYDSIQ